MEEKIEKLRQTMPWMHANVPGTGTMILLDKNGQEVGLLDLLDFMSYITPKMAK